MESRTRNWKGRQFTVHLVIVRGHRSYVTLVRKGERPLQVTFEWGQEGQAERLAEFIASAGHAREVAA